MNPLKVALVSAVVLAAVLAVPGSAVAAQVKIVTCGDSNTSTDFVKRGVGAAWPEKLVYSLRQTQKRFTYVLSNRGAGGDNTRSWPARSPHSSRTAPIS